MRNNGCIDSEQVVAVASVQDRAAWLQIYCAMLANPSFLLDNKQLFISDVDKAFDAYKERWPDDSDS